MLLAATTLSCLALAGWLSVVTWNYKHATASAFALLPTMQSLHQAMASDAKAWASCTALKYSDAADAEWRDCAMSAGKGLSSANTAARATNDFTAWLSAHPDDEAMRSTALGFVARARKHADDLARLDFALKEAQHARSNLGWFAKWTPELPLLELQPTLVQVRARLDRLEQQAGPGR